LTSSPEASHASPSVKPESDSEKPTRGICGPPPPGSLARYDPAERTWRTSQACLFQDTLSEYSETWPVWGTVLDGVCWERPPLVLGTTDDGCGYWPTPHKFDETGLQRSAEARARALRLGGCANLRELVDGVPSPTWVEWLMGWPLGWTDPESQRSAMARSRSVRRWLTFYSARLSEYRRSWAGRRPASPDKSDKTSP
jgi:hypothetical protein